MVKRYPDRVAAIEWARSVGGGKRLVGGDWIFTEQQIYRLRGDYDALAAERDALRKDAERLRGEFALIAALQAGDGSTINGKPECRMKCKRCGDTGWLQGDPILGISDEPCGCDENWEE